MSELAKYVNGKDWSATETAATGKGAAVSDFKGLQADLNTFATPGGFEAVAVDGALGARTVAAVKATYDAVLKKNPLLAATPFPVPDTKEEVAEYAAFIRGWLMSTAATALGVGTRRRYLRGEGKEWNLKGEIAYGGGAVHDDFKHLQSELNQFASVIGAAKLEVDGFIGAKSAHAVKAIYDAVVKKNPLLAATPFPVPDTKEEVAEYASYIRGWLKDTAAKALSVAEMA